MFCDYTAMTVNTIPNWIIKKTMIIFLSGQHLISHRVNKLKDLTSILMSDENVEGEIVPPLPKDTHAPNPQSVNVTL